MKADKYAKILFGVDDPEFSIGRRQKQRRRTNAGLLVPRKTPRPHRPNRARQLRQTVRHAPEVVIKITDKAASARTQASIKLKIDYISRNGKVPLVDQDGQVHSGRKEVDEAFYEFAYAGHQIPIKSNRRETYNVVLSVKEGDAEKVKDAAAEFAKEAFGEKRQYLMALHTDTDNPHVHIVVKSADEDGERLNPRKAQLQQWREIFAEKLLDRDIDANATPRMARGVTIKPRKQKLLHMDRKAREGKTRLPRVTMERIAAARRGDVDGPWTEPLKRRYDQVKAGYEELAQDHAGTQLGRDIMRFAQTMPPLITLREAYRAAYLDHQHRTQMATHKSQPDPRATEPAPPRRGLGVTRDRIRLPEPDRTIPNRSRDGPDEPER